MNLYPGIYYYRFLVDSLLITNPQSKENQVTVNGDSVSVRTVGKSILPLISTEVGLANSDSSYNYWMMQMGAIVSYPIDPYSHIQFRMLVTSGYLPIPPTKYSYVGGIGTIRGYNDKEFKGGEVVIYNLEYERHFYYNNLIQRRTNSGFKNRAGFLFLIDYAEIGSLQAENYSWNDWDTYDNYDFKIYKTSMGLGLMWHGIRFIAAKRMDRNENDWSFMIQFGTFIDRKYPYPN